MQILAINNLLLLILEAKQSKHVTNGCVSKIITNEISSGIYFVSIDYLGERVYTQRIVIDK